MAVERPPHVTRDALKARLGQVIAIKEKWKANPDYTKTLDVEIYALQVALEQMSGASECG